MLLLVEILLHVSLVLGGGIDIQLVKDILNGTSPGCTVFLVCASSSDCPNDVYTALEGLDVAIFSYNMDSVQDGLLEQLIEERQVLGENSAICNMLVASPNSSAGSFITELENRFFKAKSMEVYAFVEQDFLDSYEPMPVIFSTHFMVLKPENVITGVYMEHLQCPNSNNFALSNTWSSSSGFVLPVTKCNPNLLNGRHINIAMSVQAYAPFLTFVDGKVTGGADLDVFNIAAQKLNFSFDVHYEGIYGAPVSNGQWIGLVGVVWNGSCTFGLGHVIQEAFFHQAVDNLHYLYPLNLVIIAPKPKPLLPYTNIMNPFAPYVWLVIVLALASVAVVIFVIMKSSEVAERGQKHSMADLIYVPLFETVATLLNQSDVIYHNFETPPKKILLWFWLIGDLFIKCFYASLLFGSLIKVEFDSPINTMEDVLKKGKHLYLFSNTPFIEFLRASDIPSYKAIYQQVIQNNQFTTTVDGKLNYSFEKKLLRDGDCYLLTHQMALAGFPAESSRWGSQPFRIADQNAFPFFGGFIGRKHARENRLLDGVLGRLIDSGIVDQLIGRYIKPEYLHPAKKEDDPAVPITNMHLLGMYVVLALGLVVAGLTFLIELGHKSENVTKRRRKTYKAQQRSGLERNTNNVLEYYDTVFCNPNSPATEQDQ